MHPALQTLPNLQHAAPEPIIGLALDLPPTGLQSLPEGDGIVVVVPVLLRPRQRGHMLALALHLGDAAPVLVEARTDDGRRRPDGRLVLADDAVPDLLEFEFGRAHGGHGIDELVEIQAPLLLGLQVARRPVERSKGQ